MCAMEGTNDNYEPMNGRPPGPRQTLGTGTVSESSVCDPDSEQYPCVYEMEQVLMELDCVEKICEEIILKFQAPEGPGTSQSDISQCSIENTAVMHPLPSREAEKGTDNEKKKREKFVPPVDFIDLSSDDSGSTLAVGRQEPAVSSLAVNAQEPTVLSDDEGDVQYEPYVWSSGRAPDRVTWDKDDALASVWETMARAIDASGVDQGPIPTLGNKKDKVTPRAKRRKVDDNAAVLHDVNVSYEHPSIQLAEEANELVQVETIPAPRAKKPRGRPRKDAGISQVECRTNEKLSNKAKGKEIDQTGNQEVAQAQKLSTQGTTQGTEKKRKMKDGVELLEDEIDEDDEEFGQAKKSTKGDADLGQELLKITKQNGEKVDYEPYMWRDNKEDEEDEDAELEEMFNDMNIVVASTLGPPPDMMAPDECSDSQGGCDHKNFDFDDEVGYYCEDCGSVGIEMPTSETRPAKKGACEHLNWEFEEDVGDFCIDCGHVITDIEKKFLLSKNEKSARKPVNKVQETVSGVPQFQLPLQIVSSNQDFHAAELQLHPYFKEHLHPHQKKGFKFLTENLSGGQHQSKESVGCVLAHAPGTGKTCLMISFIQSFLARCPEGRPLILAPKIMLRGWEKEFENWKVDEVSITRIYGCSTRETNLGDGEFEEDDEEEDAKLPPSKTVKEHRARKLREWHDKGRGILLMSYTLFANLVTNGVGENVPPESLDYQMSKFLLDGPNLVILDEGHLARNNKTKISQALLAMETKRRVLLSGTLFQNNFKELYTLLKLCRDDFMISHPQYGKRIAELAANVHGPKYNSGVAALEKRSKKELMQIEERIFTEEIGDRLENYVKSGDSRTDEIEQVVMKLQSLTASFVDWYPGEILKSLPGLFEYSIHLNLTGIQLQTVAELPYVKHHMSRQCALLAVCIHPSLLQVAGKPHSLPTERSKDDPAAFEREVDREAHKGVKVTFILQLVASCTLAKEKVLIFCSTLTPLTYIEDLLEKKMKWQKGKQILRLDGTMQDTDRQTVIEQFNRDEGESQVLLASTKACKEGITLVGASRVVIIDNPDNPSVVRQAVSRAFRIGQQRKVFVYRLVTTNREEEDVFRRSVNKERLSQVLLDPVSTMARLGGFLREQTVVDVEDKLLRELMVRDRNNAKSINMVNRYNASV